jgi:hypothetical protein
MILLLKLVLAHLAGDFLFQPDSWVKSKETKKLRAYPLYIHSIIHFILIMVIVWDLNFLKWAALLAIFHLLTDIAKIFLQKTGTKRIWFFADQMAHFILIFLAWIWYQDDRIILKCLTNEHIILFITCLYAITQPASALIKSIILKWAPETSNKSDSLEYAGKYIGILERLFVFVFIVSDNWEAIGFLLAAKSVFRFGDLKESKDRRLTEYVLIGTLLSFGIAITVGLIFIKLIPLIRNG